MLDRSPRDHGQGPHESAPTYAKTWADGRHLDCVCLEDTTAIGEFCHSLAEKPGKLELCLNGENSTDQQWIFISAALYEAIAQIIDYKSKSHQDWFDNNSDAIHNLLNNITDTKHIRIPKETPHQAPLDSSGRGLDGKCRGLCGPYRTRGGQRRRMNVPLGGSGRHIKSLEQFHICCLHRILGITCRDQVPHTEILRRTGCRSIEATVTQYQLRWACHKDALHRLPCTVFYSQLHQGQRSAGGQKKCFKHQLKTALKKCKSNLGT